MPSAIRLTFLLALFSVPGGAAPAGVTSDPEERGGAFMAVGALHLPGGEGLVALLRNAGYTVTPVE